MTLDTRISLQKLEILCTVVEAGGVSRAAESLYLSQPVVSTHIRSLEERLGVDLFIRAGRGIELTDQGRSVYLWARECLALGRDMIRDLEGFSADAAERLTVAASTTVETYILPKLFSDFLARASSPPSELLTCPGFVQGLNALRDGEVDFALTYAGSKAFPADLEAEFLRDEDLVLVSAPLSSAPERVRSHELEDLPFVCGCDGSERRRLIDSMLADRGVTRRHLALALDHPSTVKEFVRQGVGVAFLFRSSVVEELSQETLSEIELVDLDLATSLVLLSRPEKQLSPAQASFLSFCREALSPIRDREMSAAVATA